MGNIYVSQLRDLLKIYYANEQERNDQRKRILEIYSEDFQQGELQKLRDLSESDHEHKTEVIHDIFQKITNQLTAAAEIRPEALTADRFFFQANSGFRLTRAEVEQYIQKYQENPTMCRLINDWLLEKEEQSAGKPSEYVGLHAYTPQDRLAVYKQFTDSALSIADRIHNGSASSWEVTAFADENFAAPLFDVIGDGMN